MLRSGTETDIPDEYQVDNAEMRELIEENETMLAQIEGLEHTNQQLEDALKISETKNTSMTTELESLQVEVEQLRADKKDLEAKCDDLTELTAEYDNLQDLLNGRDDTIMQLEARNYELEQLISEMREDNAKEVDMQSNERIAHLEAQLETMKNEANQEEKKMESVKNLIQSAIAHIRAAKIDSSRGAMTIDGEARDHNRKLANIKNRFADPVKALEHLKLNSTDTVYARTVHVALCESLRLASDLQFQNVGMARTMIQKGLSTDLASIQSDSLPTGPVPATPR